MVAAGVPIAWTRHVHDEYLLPELAILSLGILIAAGGAALLDRDGAPRSSRLDRPLTATLCIWALSTAFSADPLLSLLGTYGGYTYGLWQMALYAAVFQLASLADALLQRRILRSGLASAMLVSAYAVIQHTGLDPLTRIGDLPTGYRAVATLGSPVFLGAYLVVWLPLALHSALSEPGETAFGRCAFALIGAGLLSTVSRGAWLAAMLGSVVYLGLTGRLRAPRWTRGQWAAGLLIVAAAVACASYALLQRGGLRLGHEGERVAIWRMAGSVFLQNPWLGAGPDTFEQGLLRVRTEDFIRLLGQGYWLGHAHNEFLQVLATTGLLGLTASLWLLCGLSEVGRRELHDPARRDLAAGLISGLAALLFVMQFNIVSLPSCVMAALTAGILNSSRRPEKRAGQAWRPRGIVLLIFAVASVLCSLRLVAADHAFKLAHGTADRAQARRHYLRSLELNPCELRYHLDFGKHLVDAAGKEGGTTPQEAATLLSRCGETALACHRNDSVALYIGGYAALMQAFVGRSEFLTQAEERLDAALLLDPFRLDFLDWRRKAAQLRGDKDLERKLLLKIDRVKSLHH